MSITSWARPLTKSATALPADSASLVILCPAGVQRNTKRLPAAKAAALAGSDGTATMRAGAGMGSAVGVGKGVAAILFTRRQSVECGLNGRQHGFQIGELLVLGFRLGQLRQIGALHHPGSRLVEKRSRQVHDLFIRQ